eukprot:scaffold49036_cov45-Attheya_sp.AAC.1
MPLEQLADSNSGPDIYLPRQQQASLLPPARRTVRWKGEASQEQEDEPLDLLALARADLVEAARRLEKKRARETEEREERKRPRNPIALAKQEILDKDTNPPVQLQSRPIMNDYDRPSDVSASSVSVRTTKVVSAQHDELLWSDSEEEDSPTEPSEKKSTKSTSTKRAKIDIAPKPNQTRPAKRDSKRTTTAGGWRLLLADGVTGTVDTYTHQKKESDEEAECKLFPQLEGSIFSLEKLEPFPLPTGSQDADAKQHELPAALNRYLKPYQREGVSFLYSAVIKGSGVILGDDMGLGEICIDANDFAAKQ